MNNIADKELMPELFEQNTVIEANSKDEVIELVNSKEADAGFIIINKYEFEYYLLNKGMSDTDGKYMFSNYMKNIARYEYCAENGLSYSEISKEWEPDIKIQETILGKDASLNYWYSYCLIMILILLIVVYGTMIAAAVTTEKSNRSIEVIITSTSPESLLAGKVMAGVLSNFVQCFLILLVLLVSYDINRSVWGGKLDFVLDIPGNVMWVFALFGVGAYVLYAFLYGTMGSMVSRTEDMNKTVGNIQLLIMASYFFILFQLGNVDGIIIKVASFVPFSSFMAMLARVAMGTVDLWEVVTSLVILYMSVVLVAYIGGRIYKYSILRYGNPLTITSMLRRMVANKKKNQV